MKLKNLVPAFAAAVAIASVSVPAIAAGHIFVSGDSNIVTDLNKTPRGTGADNFFSKLLG